MYTTPVCLPKLLLPRDGVELSKCSVITCNPYTPNSLQAVHSTAKDSPSALHLMLPAFVLDDADNLAVHTQKIQQTMLQYQKEGTLKEYPAGIMLVEHTTQSRLRQGVLLAFDLEMYDNSEDSQTYIRPTQTVSSSRISPHFAVQETASLKLGHIMLLIDDPKHEIIEPLFTEKNQQDIVYDTDLTLDGGHLRSWFVAEGAETSALLDRLCTLTDSDTFHKKYGLSDDIPVLAYVVGDGNHSMAIAKENWEHIKESLSKEEQETHPARFVLAELVNIHEENVHLEAIHPVLFHIHPREVLQAADDFFRLYGGMAYCGDPKNAPSTNVQSYPCFFHGEKMTLCIVDSPWSLPYATLQNFLDDFLEKNPKSHVEYIRGADVVKTVSDDIRNMGFLLPAPSKQDLFRNIILQGPYPVKLFP